MLKLKQQKFPRLFGCTNTHLCTHGHTTYNERGGGGRREREREERLGQKQRERQTVLFIFYELETITPNLNFLHIVKLSLFIMESLMAK